MTKTLEELVVEVNPVVKADDPFFHWLWATGKSFCGLKGNKKMLDTALFEGLGECFNCRDIRKSIAKGW